MSGDRNGWKRNYLKISSMTYKREPAKTEIVNSMPSSIGKVFGEEASKHSNFSRNVQALRLMKEGWRRKLRSKSMPKWLRRRISLSSWKQWSESLRRSIGSSWGRRQSWRVSAIRRTSGVSALSPWRLWKCLILLSRTITKEWRCQTTMERISSTRFVAWTVLPLVSRRSWTIAMLAWCLLTSSSSTSWSDPP